MLEASDIQRGNKRPCVFDIQCVFRVDSVLGEEFLDRRAQELSIDEDVEGNARLAVQQVVDEGRELVSAQSFELLAITNCSNRCVNCAPHSFSSPARI